MDFRTLRYFLTVVREQNISRAANILHVTQPTLSRQMAQLEEELGTQLFLRGKHLSLTDAGVMLRRRAEEVVELMAKIEREFEEQSELGGVVSIGSGNLISSSLLPTAMQEFRSLYPKVRFEYYVNNTDYIKERLDSGLLDFGLLLEPTDITKYDYIRMKDKERWGIFTGSNNQLSGKKFITNKDLACLTLIAPNRLSMQRELASWLGMDINRLDIFTTYNIIVPDLLTPVKAGNAHVLAIEGGITITENNDIVFKPLQPELSLTSVFVWKKFQPIFGTAGKFLEFFKSMQAVHGLV